MRPSQVSRFSDSTVPVRRPSPNRIQNPRGGSLDRRRTPKPVDPELADKTPILCNKYVIDQVDGNHLVQSKLEIRLFCSIIYI